MARDLNKQKAEVPHRRSSEHSLAEPTGSPSRQWLFNKHHLLEPHTAGIDSFGFGLGGEFPERLGLYWQLDVTIGGAVLSRFRVIFNYPHQHIHALDRTQLCLSVVEPGEKLMIPGLKMGADPDPYNWNVLNTRNI